MNWLDRMYGCFDWSNLWRSALICTALAGISFAPTNSLADSGFSCARKGQSRHSLTVEGGFIESRFDTTITAPVASRRLHQALAPPFSQNPLPVVSWLSDNPHIVPGEILVDTNGSELIGQYFSSIIRREDFANSLGRPEIRESFARLLGLPSFSNFLDSLGAEQLQALAGLSASMNSQVSEFGNQLSVALQPGQSNIDSVLSQLIADPTLSISLLGELLNSTDGLLTEIAIDLVSIPDFVPVLLTQPSVVNSILAQPRGLRALTDAIEITELGGAIRWVPEQEINAALTYGYDALSWLTLTAGYRYFGADRGLRDARPSGSNPSLSLSHARLRSHAIEAGFEFGCYFDVWRPFFGVGAAYAHRSFKAEDQLLGTLDRQDRVFSHYFSAGLDVDLSKFLEIRIGYRIDQFPMGGGLSNHQISFTPAGFESPIELNDVAVELNQQGRSAGFFVYLRFFL